jgi:hypothetical protein
MTFQPDSAINNLPEDSVTEDYIEIPARIGFFKKLRLEREGQALPIERIALPLETTASIRMLAKAIFILAFSALLISFSYIFFVSPENAASPDKAAGVGARILGGTVGTICFLIGISGILAATKYFRDYFHVGPLLVIEATGFRDMRVSSSLIPWNDIVFYDWMTGKGGTYGLSFYLRHVVEGDRRWLGGRLQRRAKKKGLGEDQMAVLTTCLSSSTRVVTAIMLLLARRHGAKIRPTWYNPDSLTID